MEVKAVELNRDIAWISGKDVEDRIDSQYYRREFVINNFKLNKLKSERLSSIIYEGDYGILPNSEDYCEQGIHFVRGTDLRNLSINNEGLIKVPENYYSEKYALRQGDILMLIKGATIDAEWSASVVPNIDYRAIYNGSIFRIRLKEEYNPYYITAYMSTKYFLLQKKRAISNTGIFYNDKNSIEKFLIPIPSPEIQKYIGDKVRKAEELREEAKRLKEQGYSLIEELLNIKTGLEKINDDNRKHKWLKIEALNDRIDSEYYKEKYLETINHLKASGFQYTPLKNMVLDMYTGKKPIQIEHGKEVYFIQSGNISGNFLEVEEQVSVKVENYKVIEIGDLLIAKDGNTIGKMAVNFSGELAIINEHTYCIRFNEEYKKYSAYVYYLLINDNINELLKREATGSAQKGLNQQFIDNMIIPLINEESVEKLYEIENKRCNNIYLSKQLIQEAKKDVEDLIEGNFNMTKLNKS